GAGRRGARRRPPPRRRDGGAGRDGAGRRGAGLVPIAEGSALFTDLYELTMGANYVEHGLDQPATFDLFVRHLPPTRRFLVVCGVEQALAHLERLHVDDTALAYLASLGRFDEAFLDRLRELRFTGDVLAMPEGTVAFAGEPIVRVTAPLVEASLVET